MSKNDRKQKRDDILAGLDAVLAGKPSPLPSSRPEPLVDLAPKTVQDSGQATVQADLASLAAQTKEPAKAPETPVPAAPILPPPAVVTPKPAKPTLVSPISTPAEQAPKPVEPASQAAEPASKAPDFSQMIEKALEGKLKPLQDEISSLQGKLLNLTKMIQGTMPAEQFGQVLEFLKTSGGGVLQLVNDAQDAAAKAQKSADAAKGTADSALTTSDLASKLILAGIPDENHAAVASLVEKKGGILVQLNAAQDETQGVMLAAKAAQKSADGAKTTADSAVSKANFAGKLLLEGIPADKHVAVLSIVEKKGGLLVQLDATQDAANNATKAAQKAQATADAAAKSAETANEKAKDLRARATEQSQDIAGARTQLEQVDKTASKALAKAESAVDLSGDVAKLSAEATNTSKTAETAADGVKELHGMLLGQVTEEQEKTIKTYVKKVGGVLNIVNAAQNQAQRAEDKVVELNERMDVEGRDHASLLRYEAVGLLLNMGKDPTQLQKFADSNGVARVKETLLSLKEHPEAVRTLVIDITKPAEKNGLQPGQLREPRRR